MNRTYCNQFRKQLASMIVDKHASTIRTAEKYNVPLKTLEKWVTEYRKDSNCFDGPDNKYLIERSKKKHKYDRLTKKELISECKIRDARIEYLTSLLVANEISVE